MTSTATQSKDGFLRRINQFGHDPETIKRDGSQTTKATVNSIQDLRALIGPANDAARKRYQVSYDKLLSKKSPCDLGSVVDAYIHGTGTLTSEQHAEIEPYFPTTVTLTSAIDYTLPPGQTTYGPNQPPVVLNYGTLTIPYGSWITTLSTNPFVFPILRWNSISNANEECGSHRSF